MDADESLRDTDGLRGTAEELTSLVDALISRHPDRDGADWLRALHPLVEAAGPEPPGRAMLSLLEASLSAEAPPLDESWLHITDPPTEFDGHAATLAMIRFAAADLHRLAEAGQLDAVWLGVSSPTGHRWYNATAHSLLECGASAIQDHDLPVTWDWSLLATLLDLGRSYE